MREEIEQYINQEVEALRREEEDAAILAQAPEQYDLAEWETRV